MVELLPVVQKALSPALAEGPGQAAAAAPQELFTAHAEVHHSSPVEPLPPHTEDAVLPKWLLLHPTWG